MKLVNFTIAVIALIFVSCLADSNKIALGLMTYYIVFGALDICDRLEKIEKKG